MRAPCCEKMGLKKGPWTAEEDEILVSYIQRYGHGNWRALPKQAGLLRCGKSCRLRWTNYLRPDIKRGNFTREEEEAIISLHGQLGNKWSAIAAQLPGRTDNEIKNVWHTHLKKRVMPKSIDVASAHETQSGSSTSCSSDLDVGRPSCWAVEGAVDDVSKPMDMGSTINPASGPAPPQPQLSSEFSCSGADSSTTTDFSSDQLADIDPAFWYDALSMDVTLPTVDAPAAMPERDAKSEFVNGIWRDTQQQFSDDNNLFWSTDPQYNGYHGAGGYAASLDASLLSDGARYGQLDDTEQFWLRLLLDDGKLPDIGYFGGSIPDSDC